MQQIIHVLPSDRSSIGAAPVDSVLRGTRGFAISGNKVKQLVTIRVGIEQELSKKIVKLIKDSKAKVQASIQGDAVRVSGAKRDDLQGAIALVKKAITDFPVQFSNFRD